MGRPAVMEKRPKWWRPNRSFRRIRREENLTFWTFAKKLESPHVDSYEWLNEYRAVNAWGGRNVLRELFPRQRASGRVAKDGAQRSDGIDVFADDPG